jgi:hypothetical protein
LEAAALSGSRYPWILRSAIKSDFFSAPGSLAA